MKKKLTYLENEKEKLKSSLKTPHNMKLSTLLIILVLVASLSTLISSVAFYNIGERDALHTIASEENKLTLEKNRVSMMEEPLSEVSQQTAKSLLIVLGQNPVLSLIIFALVLLIRL